MRALLVVGLLLVQTGAGVAEPVLLLNEPHDIFMAEHFCSWAEGELRDHDYLVKHFTCSKRESCKRALDINAVCEASGPGGLCTPIPQQTAYAVCQQSPMPS
jgi:hypothetical protein